LNSQCYNYGKTTKYLTNTEVSKAKPKSKEYNLKRVGFIWCRELETAKQQHYHYALMIDGHKVNYPYEITNKIKELWRQLDGSEYFPKNCYYNVKRDDYETIQAIL
jgi:hypothetical protein